MNKIIITSIKELFSLLLAIKNLCKYCLVMIFVLKIIIWWTHCAFICVLMVWKNVARHSVIDKNHGTKIFRSFSKVLPNEWWARLRWAVFLGILLFENTAEEQIIEVVCSRGAEWSHTYYWVWMWTERLKFDR